MEKTTHTIAIKMIQKFPDWNDAEVAGLVGVTVEYVQQVRRELTKKKQG